MLKRLVRHNGGIIGGGILLLVVLTALLAPQLAPYEPTKAYFAERLSPPSMKHWLGTDHLGRDILSRVMWGARLSLVNGVGALVIGGGVGMLIGMTAGYAGGYVDRSLMRVVDVLLAFPTLLLALVAVSVLGPGPYQTLIAIGLALIARFARLSRGEVRKVKNWEFVEATRAVGARNVRIVIRHILPNTISPILVYATLRFGTVILTEASLSFLGLGPSPPTPSLGLMVNEGLGFIRTAWWIASLPGVAVFFIVLGTNLFGDALRDVWDPRTVIRAK